MRVAVLGAGVAGLVCAYRLTQEGHVCDVYERWPGLGGQAATLDVGGGDLLERYYHHLFTSDRHIVALYEELGMGDELEWKPSSMAFFLEGRQWAFNGPLDLLRFGPLSPPARLRMGLAVLLLQKRSKDVAPFESITAREWIEKRMGRGPWRKVWGPLLRGKFGARAEDISMAWLWSKLTLRRQLEGDEAKQELLGYPAHSWELLFDALRDAIVAGGGRVLIDRPAAALRRGAGRRGLRRDRGRAAGRSAPATTRAASSVPRGAGRGGALRRRRRDRPQRRLRGAARRRPARRDRVGVPRPAGARPSTTRRCACCSSSTAASRRSTGRTSPTPRCRSSASSSTRTSSRPSATAGGASSTSPTTSRPATRCSRSSEDELLAAYLPGLRRVQPEFSEDWIVARWLHREPAAQPIVTVGYHRRIPPLQTGVPGLVLANTTQIYPEDRGTNYSVRLGGDAARALLDG